MRSNAAGSFLGSGIQFPRALLRLLQSGPGDAVSIEVLGDVAVFQESGAILTEEDKSSLNENPLTDRSVNLWKTLSNWIDAILNKELEIEKTWFVLYTNLGGRNSIVTEFNSVVTEAEAQKAVSNAKTLLVDIDAKHDIWEYYNHVMNNNEVALVKLITRFELEIGNGAGFDDVRYEIKRLMVPQLQVDHILHSIQGWLVETVLENIASKRKAIITRESFEKKFLQTIRMIRNQELIDFASLRSLGEEDLQAQVRLSPMYLQQLEKIGAGIDDMIEAVTDYLKASTNRTDWIEKEIIDEEIADEFQDSLLKFWKVQMHKYSITEKSKTPEERGMLVLLECKVRQATIRGMIPPPSTIPGTYHLLADEPQLGWHPEWNQFFSK